MGHGGCEGNLAEWQRACPVHMPDLIHIRSRSAGKHWPEAGWMILAYQLACIPACLPGPFGQNLTQSARTKLDPGWFCIILSRTSLEEWNQVWKSETGSGLAAFCHNRAQWFLHNGLFPDKTCLAKPWPGHPDQIWVSFAQYDPCLLWKNGAENSEMDAGSRIWHIYIYYPGPILAARWP